MIKTFSEIEQLISDNMLDEALGYLVEQNQDEIKVCLLKGQIYHKQQQFGNAINEYNKVLEADSDNPYAKSGIQLAQSILGFFNTDMYNP